MKKYYLAIDHGTESVRAAVIDESGRFAGVGTSANTNIYPRPGWVEQSATVWEESLVKAIRLALRNSKIEGSMIRAVGVDATSPTMVAMNKNNQVVRNPIMWMDIRAAKEAQVISSINDEALKVTGFGKVSPEWFPCKVLWFKHNEPELYAQTETFLDHTDWIVYTLTGELTLNNCSATARNFYNSNGSGFPIELFRQAGMQDVLEKYPGRITSFGEVVGYITKKMAAKTGLSAETPVAGGGADGYVGVIGVNALRPGRMALITGSSQLLIGVSDREMHFPGMNGSFKDILVPGYQVIEAGQTSSGSIVKWFIDNFISARIEAEAKKRNASVYDIMNERAEGIPPGSDGLVVLEHWQGNRTPWVDPSSRGVIRGLTLLHKPEHIYRALMEGVVYGAEVILRTFCDHGIDVDEIVISGGATNSDVWLQIFADVTRRPIIMPEETQSVLLGSAIAASLADSEYTSIQEAADHMVRVNTTIEPDVKNAEMYKDYVEQYIATYEKLKGESASLVSKLGDMNSFDA